MHIIPTSQTTLSVSVTSVNANILCEYEVLLKIYFYVLISGSLLCCMLY